MLWPSNTNTTTAKGEATEMEPTTKDYLDLLARVTDDDFAHDDPIIQDMIEMEVEGIYSKLELIDELLHSTTVE